MEIQFHEIKEILNKVNKGGGSDNYTPLEICLMNKCYRYRCTIAKTAKENVQLKDTIYSMVSAMNRNGELATYIKERRKKELEASSKNAFATAVKLDNELKELG